MSNPKRDIEKRVAEVIRKEVYVGGADQAAAEIDLLYRQKLLAEPISEYIKSEIEGRLSK